MNKSKNNLETALKNILLERAELRIKEKKYNEARQFINMVLCDDKNNLVAKEKLIYLKSIKSHQESYR